VEVRHIANIMFLNIVVLLVVVMVFVNMGRESRVVENVVGLIIVNIIRERNFVRFVMVQHIVHMKS